MERYFPIELTDIIFGIFRDFYSANFPSNSIHLSFVVEFRILSTHEKYGNQMCVVDYVNWNPYTITEIRKEDASRARMVGLRR